MKNIYKALENPSPFIRGIYFSNRTGKFFEASKKWNKVYVKYCDGTDGMTFSPFIFRLQLELFSLYELLIPYEAKK